MTNKQRRFLMHLRWDSRVLKNSVLLTGSLCFKFYASWEAEKGNGEEEIRSEKKKKKKTRNYSG